MEIKKGLNKYAIVDENRTLMGEIIYEIDQDNTILAKKTFVDPVHRGLGLARILVDTLVTEARLKGQKIVPCCSYVYKTFVENKEYQDVWDQNPDKKNISCSLS